MGFLWSAPYKAVDTLNLPSYGKKWQRNILNPCHGMKGFKRLYSKDGFFLYEVVDACL